MTIQEEFDKVQLELIKHKYHYYILDAPLISDYEYDMLERQSYKLSRTLGFAMDFFEGPQAGEEDHVHFMVDFDENNKYAKIFLAEQKGKSAK